MTLRDLFTASVPAAATFIPRLTLSEWNSLVGIVGGLLGIAFLLWNWRRKARMGSIPPWKQ